MEVQTYTKKEMISLLKKYKKQVSFRRLENLAGVRHGCIGSFVYRDGKMSQERFRKIRRAWFGELQAKEIEKTHKAMCEPIKQPSCMVVCGVPEKEENTLSPYMQGLIKSQKEEKELKEYQDKLDPTPRWLKEYHEKIMQESDKLWKGMKIVDLSPWYEKLWLKIKKFVAKLFMRKTK